MFKEGDILTPTPDGNEIYVSWLKGAKVRVEGFDNGRCYLRLVRRGAYHKHDEGHLFVVNTTEFGLFKLTVLCNDVV